MFFKSSKINEFRLWGLVLTMAGMGMMVLGTVGIVFDWGVAGKIIAYTAVVLGMLTLMGSMGVYFWAGMLSTSSMTLECPECGKPTKMLGRTDRCMFCRTILTLDPKYAGPDKPETPAEPAQPEQEQAKP